MAAALHRFEFSGRRYLVDPETCFCVECDEISWDVIAHYPAEPVNRILHLLQDKHPRKELEEVISELEWLRATEAILKRPDMQKLEAAYQVQHGLRELDVLLSGGPGDAALLQQAGTLLLAGAESMKTLTLRVHVPRLEAAPTELFDRLDALDRMAGIAQKQLTTVLAAGPLERASLGLTALQGHEIYLQYTLASPLQFEGLPELLAQLSQRPISKWCKLLQGSEAGQAGILLRPGAPAFSDAVTALEEAGFKRIVLDLDGAQIRGEDVSHEAWKTGLREAATHYAKHLLRGRYYRLEPIATLFKQIYEGKPVPRSDPSGTHALAVDAEGGIYPSVAFARQRKHLLGTLAQGIAARALRDSFENLGALTTPPCMRCWARNFCGGGSAAVHDALTGNFRSPDAAWCDSQRDWIASAIAAFNILTTEGVQFDRLYGALDRVPKPGLWEMARAVLKKQAGIRPIEEGDAALVARWENWSQAAYFLFKQNSMFMATAYDREMDALHPLPYEQEWVLLDHKAAPQGLLKVRPDAEHQLAWVYVFLKEPGLYADRTLQRSLRTMLDGTCKSGGVKALLAPVGPFDTGLADFLQGLGFQQAGHQRAALYVHGGYHDVRCYEFRT
ncbi:MAG: SPASM domain-containing protein [Candidatus Hydrogenedentes bacterium]|nr:SPASM domain-containing protein [Candidatus Hydrogenedentota bacterium]